MTTQRYHKIAEESKLNYDQPEPERHRYSELDITNEALREYLFQISIDPERNQPLKRDKAHVALKLLYRLEEHHKQARDGRPHYPPFSWSLVENFSRTAPFTYQEYSTPMFAQKLGQSGGPGPRQTSNSLRTHTVPATPTEEDTA